MSKHSEEPQVQHTPGPWRVSGYSIMATNPAGEYVAVAWVQSDVSPAERAANSLLLTAAPDLLRELIAAHDRESERAEHEAGLPPHDPGAYPNNCPMCAAIAKAVEP